MHTCVGVKNREKQWEDIGVVDIERNRWGIWRKQEWKVGGHWEERETGIGERARDRRKRWGWRDGRRGMLGTEMCMCLHLCGRDRHRICVCVSGD